MAHGKQRFKSNKQGKPKSYGNSSRSQRNFKSGAHDAVISQVMAKVTGKRKHQQRNKTSRNQDSSRNGFRISSPQHQFEDMDTDDDESDTFSLPDTLDQRFEWSEGDADGSAPYVEKSAPARFESNNFSLGWGGALSYNRVAEADQSKPVNTISDTTANGIQWVIDTEGSHGATAANVPEYDVLSISDSDDQTSPKINKDRTEFSQSSSFIKLGNEDNRSTRKLGRKKRKQANRKGKRTSGADASRYEMTEGSDMDISMDYMENANEDEFDAEDHAFFNSGVEGGSPYLISSDSESDIYKQAPLRVTHKNQVDEYSSSDDILFQGYNAWDLPDQEDQDLASHNMFKRVLNGSFDDVPVSLHNGLRARMRRQKNTPSAKNATAGHTYEENSLSLCSNPHINLYQLDKSMRNFISNTDLISVRFPSMTDLSDKYLAALASSYGFASQLSSNKNKRFILLERTHSTRLPKDRSSIDDFLARAQAELLTTPIQSTNTRIRKNANTKKSQRPNNLRLNTKSSIKSDKRSTASKRRTDGGGNGKSEQFLAAPSHGTVVGGEAAPINTSNVGHRMLAAMGWKVGDSLGAENRGIKTPIQAVIRRKRSGLGT